MRLLTLPDYFSRRYDTHVGMLASLLSIVSCVICIAGNLSGIGALLERTTGMPPYMGVVVSAGVVMLYTIAGGLFAVTWNDVLQLGIAVVGFTVAIVFTAGRHSEAQLAEAWNSGFSWLPLTDFRQGALRTWASLLALAMGNVVALDFMERVFAARTHRAAQVACIASGVITAAIGLGLAYLGMLAAFDEPDVAKTGDILGYITRTLPASVSMLFFMGLIAAGISTVDGLIMACAVVCSRNILQPLAPQLVTPDRLLSVCRSTIIPVTLASVFVAVVAPVPADLLILAFDVVFSGCFVPFALGVYWSRGTTKAAFWAIVIPSGLRVLLHVGAVPLGIAGVLSGLETLIPPVVSLVLFVGISLAETRAVPELVRA